MTTIAPLLLCLLSALVEVHSQTAPYLTFMGNNIPNHGYVDLNTVGTGSTTEVQCHTDLNTCCGGAQGPDRGDWFFPDGNRLPFSGDVYEGRGPQLVVVQYTGSGGTSGIYQCDIETVAVNNNGGHETVYVGLYTSGGDVTIPDGMNFTVDSDLNGDSPQFTLTCISTAGPATTVTWTRDSETVSGGMTVFNNAVTAQYTHTLTVTGRLGGQYQCSVTNNKPSQAAANFTVQFASAPTGLTAIQEGANGIRVSWTPPTPLGDTTGCRIYYSGGSSGSMDVSGGSTDNHLLTGLQNGASNNISIVATSDHFYSDRVYLTNIVQLNPGQPTGVMVNSTTPTTISLSWTAANGTVDSYEVMWERDTSGECPDVDEGSATISGSSTSHTISGLEEDSNYTITVTAINTAGSAVSVPVTAVTGEAAPSAPPTSVSTSDMTSSSIAVQWGPVDCIDRNGDITGYSVRYVVVGNGSAQTVNVSGGTTECNISGLSPASNYSVEVAARNGAGAGIYSAPVFVITEAPMVLATSPPHHGFLINGVLYEASSDYVAVYVVDFNQGTPNPLKITCSSNIPTTRWINDRGLSTSPQPHRIPDTAISVSTNGENLIFQGFHPSFVGTYSCSGDQLRLYVTNENPYVNVTNPNPLIVRLSPKSFNVSAVIRMTLEGGKTVSIRDAGPAALLSIQYDQVQGQRGTLNFTQGTDKTPYESFFVVERNIDPLFVTTIFVRVDLTQLDNNRQASFALRVEDIFPPIFPFAMIVELNDLVTLNCTPTINTTTVQWTGPSVSNALSANGFVASFNSTLSRNGYYRCRVRFPSSISRSTYVLALPENRDLAFVTLSSGSVESVRPDNYIWLNTNRNEGILGFFCVARSGTVQLFSENSQELTNMFRSVNGSGGFMVGGLRVEMTKGDRFTRVQIDMGSGYEDTIKCFSEATQESVRIRIVNKEIFVAVHSSTPLSANLTTSVNLSFVYVNVNSGAENLFQILKDGVIIASGNNINTVVGNDQIYYYTLTVNSTSGGNYTFRDARNANSNVTIQFSIVVPTLTISPKNITANEGASVLLSCTPSLPSLRLQWITRSNSFITYPDSLRHSLNITRASGVHHEGVYVCRAADSDARTLIASVNATVNVIDYCDSEFSGGVLWDAAVEGSISIVSCSVIDNRFSPTLLVTRLCNTSGAWLPPNFSGCTLVSPDPVSFVIFSMLATTIDRNQRTVSSANIAAVRADRGLLRDLLNNVTVTNGRAVIETSSLTILPETLLVSSRELILLRFIVSYNAAEAQRVDVFNSALALLCRSMNLALSNTTVVIQFDRGDYFPFQRSDNCECKLQGTNSPSLVPTGDRPQFRRGLSASICVPRNGFQRLCNGTQSSPCDCTADLTSLNSIDCRCIAPYTGNTTLCTLDVDGDSYPQRPLTTCPANNTQPFCQVDTCPTLANADQNDVTPCRGFEQGVLACVREVDNKWMIEWRYTLASEGGSVTVTTSCGVDNIGNASRPCFSNGSWGDVVVTQCARRSIIVTQFRISRAVQQKDSQEAVDAVTEVVAAISSSDTPLFPKDIDSINQVVSNAIDLLSQSLDKGGNSQIDTTSIFDVLDLVLHDNNAVSFSLLQQNGVGSEGVLNNVERYAFYLGRVLGEQTSERLREAIGMNIVLRTEVVSTGSNYQFPAEDDMLALDTANGSSATVLLPQGLLVANAKGNSDVVVASVLFRNIQSFLPVRNADETPRSLVISSQLATREDVTAASGSPVTITFEFQLSEDVSNDDIQCVFWNFENNTVEGSTWSREGLTTVSVVRDGDMVTVVCSSLHLTSFAVLTDVGGAQIQSEALKIVSYIGLAISLACLLLTIIFFLTFGKELFIAMHNFVHLNLAIALFVGYLVFAVGVELAADNDIACNAVTALIQYFLLAAFSWMLCEGVMLYLMLVVVFSEIRKKWWFFFLLGWGIPVIFVAVGLGAVRDEYGVKDDNGDYKYCWLSSGNGTYAIWTFVAPMLAIIIINSVFLVLVLFSIFKNRAGRSQRVDSDKRVDVATYLVKASVILLPLLGLTWVFGLFAVNENTVVFAWLFTIFNSLQGLFIFIFHVLRNDKVWGRLKKKYDVYTSSVKGGTKSTASTGKGYRGVHSSGASSGTDVELKEVEQSVAVEPDAGEVLLTENGGGAPEPTKM